MSNFTQYTTLESDGRWYIRRCYRNGGNVAYGPYRWEWLAQLMMVFTV